MLISSGAGNSQGCVSAGNCFYPDNALIATGDTLTWINQDSVSHTVTSGKPSDTTTGSSFDSGIIRPGSTYSLTFPYAGTYDYFCAIHPWMTGSITVKTASSNTQTQSPLKQILSTLFRHQTKPVTTIQSDTVNWYFGDSMGNKYHWSMPLTTYDTLVQQPISVGVMKLTLPNGQTAYTYDYSQFVKTIMASPSFTNVMDQVYNNAGSDEQFIYQTWYIVSEMTTYNVDMTNYNLWPLEVFTRGEGDCKDKSILIADMLHSSSHTANWQITLKIIDSNNPSNPITPNHMIVLVNTGQKNYAIESTATPDNDGLNVWAGQTLVGWNIPT
jgi:plastocyanin